MYAIAAVPTRYRDVNFRSRLEARWAAFFDQCGLEWAYEPVDFPGWCPDFGIITPFCTVFAEVKPVERLRCSDDAFEKAFNHWQGVQVLLLGLRPEDHQSFGFLLDEPDGAAYDWLDLMHFLDRGDGDRDRLWRLAGNAVQFKPVEPARSASGRVTYGQLQRRWAREWRAADRAKR